MCMYVCIHLCIHVYVCVCVCVCVCRTRSVCMYMSMHTPVVQEFIYQINLLLTLVENSGINI